VTQQRTSTGRVDLSLFYWEECSCGHVQQFFVCAKRSWRGP